MRKKSLLFLSVAAFLFACGILAASTLNAAPAAAPGDRLALSGIIKTSTGKAVKEAEVEALVNGQPYKAGDKDGHENIVTSKQGGFVTDLVLPPGTLPGAKVEVKAHKPSWKAIPPTPVQVVESGTTPPATACSRPPAISP